MVANPGMTTSHNKMMRALITTLAADNSNQAEFLTSVKMVAGQFGATSFLTRGRSRSRKATRMDFMSPPKKNKTSIKNESGSEAESKDTKEEGDENTARKAAVAKSKKAQMAPSQGESGSSSNPIPVDNSPLDDDDVEAALLGDYPLFFCPGSATEIESTADNAIRMKLFQQLTLATQLHLGKVRTCKVGDVYGFLKLVLKNIIVTGQSLYLHVIALSEVKFDSSISVSDLDSALKEVQTKANRLKDDVIDEDIMRGAVLSLAQKHSNFQQLATEFSKKSSTATYDEIIDDFLQHEANTAVKPSAVPPRGLANMMTEPSITQLAAAFTLALNKPKQTTKPSQEACRNFSRGKCVRDDCRFSHASSSSTAPTTSAPAPPFDSNNRKRITCYNCQKAGYHRASECTAPKEERRRPRGAGGEEANHTETKVGDMMDVSEFMEKFVLRTAQRKKADNDGDECAHLCVDYDMDLDASTRVPSAAQEQAARMCRVQRRCDWRWCSRI